MSTLRLIALLSFAPIFAAAQTADKAKFSFDDVRKIAADRASQPYKQRKSEMAKFWADLKYDGHREIEFRRDQAVWAGQKLGYELQFFHPGWVFPKTVTMAEIVDGEMRELAYDPAYFNYRKLEVPPDTPPPPGYAGFRIHAPLNDPNKMDELAVLLGASYFRAIAPGLGYGLSARGLALNTARPQGEEFPDFERHWVEKPTAPGGSLKFYSLLDSPSVAGAYQFKITPGRATIMDVDAELTFRKEVELIGIAPFSSMLWFSELTHPKPVDFRPEVHDSDGLLIQYASNDAVWRPLDNSKVVRHSVFSTEKFLGFGLIQRDRDVANYQDFEANYHNRPSAFVEPVGTWPPGRVHLIELPTGEEFWDNIVCFWEPAEHPKPGEPFRISYRIHWLAEMGVPGLSRVLASRRSHHVYKPEEKKPDDDMFVVDFAPLQKSEGADEEPTLFVEAGPGANLLSKHVQKNPVTGGWRATFRLHILEETDTLEVACRLLVKGRPASEKWSCLWKK